MGIAFSMHAAPVYISETSTPSARGLLVSLKEGFIVLGAFIQIPWLLSSMLRNPPTFAFHTRLLPVCPSSSCAPAPRRGRYSLGLRRFGRRRFLSSTTPSCVALHLGRTYCVCSCRPEWDEHNARVTSMARPAGDSVSRPLQILPSGYTPCTLLRSNGTRVANRLVSVA